MTIIVIVIILYIVKQKIQIPDISSERTSLLNQNFIEMINID